MARITRVKNMNGDNTWVGQTILAGEYYDVQMDELPKWIKNSTVFSDIGSGTLIVNNGTDVDDDFNDPIFGWNWFSGVNDFPVSDVDDTKLAVHASSKPSNIDKTIYALWAGSGDDMTTGEISGGDMLEFQLVPGTAFVKIDMKFKPSNGKVWLHEGYLKFTDGGSGDYFNATVVAEATPLQTAVNLDLIVTGDVISYSTGGPGTGTHGFADADMIVLTPRSYSGDGEWDYDGIDLTPNFANTGGYRISTVEQMVHRFMHKIPALGTANNYFTMSSDESSVLPANYFVRIEAHNISDTTWSATAIVELFRERSFNP